MTDLLARTYAFMAELESAAVRRLDHRWQIVLTAHRVELVVKRDRGGYGGYYFERATIEATPAEHWDRIIAVGVSHAERLVGGLA